MTTTKTLPGPRYPEGTPTLSVERRHLRNARKGTFVTPIDEADAAAYITIERVSRNQIRLEWCSFGIVVSQSKFEDMVLNGDDGPWRLVNLAPTTC